MVAIMAELSSGNVDVSIREAAGLVGTSPKQIRNEFQRVLVKARRQASGTIVRRRLNFPQLMYFAAIEWLRDEGVELQPDLRSKLYDSLSQQKLTAVAPWVIHNRTLRLEGRLPVDISLQALKAELQNRLDEYRKGEALVQSKTDVLGGEPVFKGTRVPVVQLVDLFRQGTSEEEVREDYPQLPREAITYARLKAAMGPGPGRPRKPLQVSRVDR